MPTSVFCCGFECGVTGSVGQHWAVTGTASISTSTVRSGARSGRANPTASVGFLQTPGNWSSRTWVIRGYVYFATLPAADSSLLFAGSNAGAVFSQADSKIYAGYGTGAAIAKGATGVAVTTGRWYQLDIKVISTANPWTVDVSVDQVACGQHTQAVAAADNIVITAGIASNTANTTADVFFDDIVASNTPADFPIGAGYVNHFVPTSDGTHNVAGAGDFAHGTAGTDILNSTTDANTLIDDVPLPSSITTTDLVSMVAPPNATDYVECVLGPASGISSPTTAPRAVEVISAIHQAGTGTGNMETRIKVGHAGTTAVHYTATTVAGVTSLAYKRSHHPTAPGSVAWAVSGSGNFNDLRVEMGSPAAVDANPDQYWDAIMVEAEFVAAAAFTDYELLGRPDGAIGQIQQYQLQAR